MGGRTPDALVEIERFLTEELERLDATSNVPPEVRLQPHREALDLFIAQFGTYAGPLSAIKRAYEAQIEALRAALRRKSHEQDAAQAEFEQTHERITSSLRSQLEETTARLADARWQIKQLQDGDVDPDGEPLSATSPKVACRCSLGAAGGAGGSHPSAVGSDVAATGEESSKLKGWTAVVKSIDAPQKKVGRLLKAVERLCTTPEMLRDATVELCSMLSAKQVSDVVVHTAGSLTSDERVDMACALSSSLTILERALMFERELKGLGAQTAVSVLEPVLIGLPEAQRGGLLPLLIESARSEDERLTLIQLLLKWRERGRPAVVEKRASQTKQGIADESGLRAIDLAHSDRLLRLLIDLWEDTAVERAAQLLQTMPHDMRKRTCGQILASDAVDALQLEQALELIYSKEDEEVAENPMAMSELSARRREAAVARKMLREGRAPKQIATANRVSPADVDDAVEAASGGWRLTCDCTRQWVLPNTLLGKLKGEKGAGAPALSIRRFEDVRFESVEQKLNKTRAPRAPRPAREQMQRRSTRNMRKGGLPAMEPDFALSSPPEPALDDTESSSKESWHLATSALLAVVAELWTAVLTDGRLAEARLSFRKLDVAAVLWERLLHKHALKTVAQRALTDLTSSLQAEAASPSCIGRLRLAAEMIGLGDDETPWSESKAHFFFWLLPLCVPQKRMHQNLLDVHVQLPLSAVIQLVTVAVAHEPTRQDLIRQLTDAASESQPSADAASSAAAGAPSGTAARAALESRGASQSSSTMVVLLDTVLVTLMDVWSEHLERAAVADEKRLLHMTRDFDENGDGVLDFNEFCKLVRNGIGGFDEMLPLYEDVLQRTQEMRKAASDAAYQPGQAAAAYTLRIPDAIDPAAFAEVVARRTRLVPPGFYVPDVKGAGNADDATSEGGKSSFTTARASVSQIMDSPLVHAAKTGFLQSHGLARPERTSSRADPGANAEEIELVVASLANNFLFSSMEREQLRELALQMARQEHAEGTRIIQQGESGDYFYVLVSGHADALRREDEVAHVRANETASERAERLLNPQPRDAAEVTVLSYASHDIDKRCFGERALLQAVPRQASVVLRSKCVLYAMSRRHFRAALRHTRAVDVLGALRKFGWLGELPDSDLRALRDTMIERTFEDGEMVVKQGDKADTAFVIISGFARVTQHNPESPEAPPTELPGYLSQATCFGDTMLMADGVRGANVIAAGALRCMQLTRTALLLQVDDEVLERRYAVGQAPPLNAGQWKAKGLNRSLVSDEPALNHLP